MRSPAKEKKIARFRRHRRIRRKVKGTAACPRVSVFRSLNHIYGQIVDDVTGKTLLSASSLGQGLKGNIEEAAKVGAQLAKKAMAAKIQKVVFDRGGNLYHGRVKAFADAAKKGGLIF
ncbi:MAG: 50S ribosomal protein L18 [Nitrospiria bacterium]